MKPKRSIRMSQGITTFGVGAIYGLGEESFINTDIKKWIANSYQKVEINFPRLARKLNVEKFMHPKPAGKYGYEKSAKFRFMRFPSWLFCPICRSMKHIGIDESNQLNGEVPTCYSNKCKGYNKKNMLPMRFIVACENGHIDDFPWHYWAHTHTNTSDSGNCKDYNNLSFITKSGAGASYSALYVKCKTCGSSRSLAGLEDKDALKSVGLKCKGKQPWQSHTTVECECDETPVMKQRNASNIYQPVIVSAIDIDAPSGNPDDNSQSLVDIVKEHSLYTACVHIYDSGGVTPGFKELVKQISNNLDYSQDEIMSIFTGDFEEESTTQTPQSIYELKLSLQVEEWPFFFMDVESKKFINKVEKIDGSNELLNEFSNLLDIFDNISLVKKLKEVRVFKGFGRLKFDPGKVISPSLDKYTNWLPAIEVFGEGIFISIDKVKIDNWYNKNKKLIDKKIKAVQDSYELNELEGQFGLFSAKFVMLHTLSHLLIRQLAFESGYNSSSLRESIYFSDEYNMAGVFIYTADSDSEGSLGGLVRQGELDRLLPTILLSLKKSKWCSSDPVCSESNKGQGERGLNQGACHACALISETSCSHFNSLLSRSLLIDKKIGFFKEIVLDY